VKPYTKLRLATPLLLALALWLTGCAAAVVGGAAGAGAVLFNKGELTSVEKAPVDRVYRASLDAVNKLNLETVEKTSDTLKAKILAKEKNGDNVNINIEQKPNNLTELKIKIGATGNEDRARAVLAQIQQELNES
jgi:ABC-type glycerol-3-phosphate transport system substrate-binding protein